MNETLLAELIAYLGDDYDESMSAQANLCVNRAVLSFRTYMNYPSTFDNADIEADMEANHFCLFDLALYFWNLYGMEYQTEHREAGATLVFNTEATIYATHGVIPYATVM